MVPDNLIVYILQPIGGFHETSQIFTHAEIITSNDQKRDHTGWATARGKKTCIEIRNTTTLKACT